MYIHFLLYREAPQAGRKSNNNAEGTVNDSLLTLTPSSTTQNRDEDWSRWLTGKKGVPTSGNTNIHKRRGYRPCLPTFVNYLKSHNIRAQFIFVPIRHSRDSVPLGRNYELILLMSYCRTGTAPFIAGALYYAIIYDLVDIVKWSIFMKNYSFHIHVSYLRVVNFYRDRCFIASCKQ